ncbi:MAG: alpha-1,4-glucan--maltose-1-phosphate maltosyltransferase, partial [Pseudomonadota bacterium]|nr:alpha-1,4-glucan--maltose-1-phosphate maltosyltransferase [Pseudomonadota bacterium]
DIIFLSEAFTRPRVMHRLAKVGFSQSYTYFTWRNTKDDLVAYFTELSQDPSREYFRPNVWPNTPDILHEQLHGGRRPVFMTRLVLASTLAANYGIYGPAYELLEGTPREPRSEEYRDSEKYQLGRWNLAAEGNLGAFVTTLNRIRRDNPALHDDWCLRFCAVDNDQLIAYAKTSGDNAVVCVVNLDPDHAQSGWLELDLAALGLAEGDSYEMHDLLTDQRFFWQGARNFVILDPNKMPAHVMRLVPRARSEQDFG